MLCCSSLGGSLSIKQSTEEVWGEENVQELGWYGCRSCMCGLSGWVLHVWPSDWVDLQCGCRKCMCGLGRTFLRRWARSVVPPLPTGDGCRGRLEKRSKRLRDSRSECWCVRLPLERWRAPVDPGLGCRGGGLFSGTLCSF